MAYWLDSNDGEWGFAGVVESQGLRVAESHRNQEEHRVWVDHFIELMDGRITTRVIEDRAEFEFLFRCLERIGKPLAFSPIVPSIEAETQRLLSQAA